MVGAIEPKKPKKIENPAVETGRRAIPDMSDEQRAFELCYTVRPDLDKFKGSLDKGPFRKEFKELIKVLNSNASIGTKLGALRKFFKIPDMSKRFCVLLLRNGKIEDTTHFIKAMDRWVMSCKVFGQGARELAEKTEIVEIPPGKGGELLAGLKMEDLYKRPDLKNTWEMAKSQTKDLAEIFEASSNDTKDLMVSMLIAEMLTQCGEKRGYRDINKMSMLSDPWVLSYMKEMVVEYAKHRILPTHAELDSLERFQNRVKQFKEWAGNNGLNAALQKFNASKENVEYLLNNYKTLGPEGVSKYVEAHPPNAPIPESSAKAPTVKTPPVQPPAASVTERGASNYNDFLKFRLTPERSMV